MKNKYQYYLVNKICSIVAFIIFYLFAKMIMEKINIYLPFDMWGIITIGLIINLIFGVIMGWFLLDEIKIKVNKYQNIATVSILLLLSFYQVFYFMPVIGNYLSPEFSNAAKYAQLLLGIYIIFYLQRIFRHRKLKKKGTSN